MHMFVILPGTSRFGEASVLALKKIPYRKVASLIAARLSTDEHPGALDLVRRMRRAKERGYLTRAEFEAACGGSTERCERDTTTAD